MLLITELLCYSVMTVLLMQGDSDMPLEKLIVLSWFDSLSESDKNALMEALESDSIDTLSANLVESYPHHLLQIASLVRSE